MSDRLLQIRQKKKKEEQKNDASDSLKEREMLSCHFTRNVGNLWLKKGHISNTSVINIAAAASPTGKLPPTCCYMLVHSPHLKSCPGNQVVLPNGN